MFGLDFLQLCLVSFLISSCVFILPVLLSPLSVLVNVSCGCVCPALICFSKDCIYPHLCLVHSSTTQMLLLSVYFYLQSFTVATSSCSNASLLQLPLQKNGTLNMDVTAGCFRPQNMVLFLFTQDGR